VSVVALPTIVSAVLVGRVRVPEPLTMLVIVGAVRVLFDKVCVPVVPTTTSPTVFLRAASGRTQLVVAVNALKVPAAARVPPIAGGLAR
jgi:hypothetical protein